MKYKMWGSEDKIWDKKSQDNNIWVIVSHPPSQAQMRRDKESHLKQVDRRILLNAPTIWIISPVWAKWTDTGFKMER